MKRTSPPFRADHVGSLLRPPELLQARAEHFAGKLSAQQLSGVEDAAVLKAVRLQEDLGLRAITDGEYRRGSWHLDFLSELGGVETVKDPLKIKFENAQGHIEFTHSALKVAGKLSLTHTIFGEAFAFLKKVVNKGTPKLTIPSPSMLHYRGGQSAIDSKVYPDPKQFWEDLGRAYVQELTALRALGCTYLQMDDTSLAYLNDPKQREAIKARGGDEKDQHLTYIKAFNAAMHGRPADMTICTHLCRGNFRSSWVASGGYDYVAEALFNQLEVDGYFLEFDDERSGSFEPLRFVPKDKNVILGLITSKRAQLESKDEIKRRLDEASKFISLDQVCLSPQCGFSSTEDGNSLSWDEQRAKLALVVEIASEVWNS